MRPVILKDISIFGTPRAKKGKKRVRKVLQDDDQLELTQRSNHSRKSSRSVRRLTKPKRPQSTNLGQRKNRKSFADKIRSKSRSKSAKKQRQRGTSVESDEIYNRLSKPVDHTATKKRILKEEREKLEQSMYSSRKSREPTKRSLSSKKMMKQYRQFIVKKFGKENEPVNADIASDQSADDKWRRTNDFTNIIPRQKSLKRLQEGNQSRHASSKKQRSHSKTKRMNHSQQRSLG